MATLSDLLVSYKQVEVPTNTSIPEPPEDRFSRLQQYIDNRDTDDSEEVITPFRWHYNPKIKNTSTTTYNDINFSNNKGKNAEYAYKYFVSHGIPSASAAGIVGNLYHEDLGNPERTVRDSHGTTAYGIAGFNSKGDLPNLLKWAKANNINGNPNFNQQLDYLIYIINSGRNPTLTSIIMNSNTTPEEASYAWGRYFEKFAGRDGTGRGYLNRRDKKHIKRGNTSRQLYNKYG